MRFGLKDKRPYNHYRCSVCGRTTITKDLAEGTTPFLIECRATLDCKGLAQSTMYRGPQDETQAHHGEWYRPTPGELDVELQKYPQDGYQRQYIYDHVNKGGLLFREVHRPDRPKPNLPWGRPRQA